MGSKIDVDLLLLDGAAIEWLGVAMPEGQVQGDIGPYSGCRPGWSGS
jgi:hypothetical protein